jgi:hypothetical protein
LPTKPAPEETKEPTEPTPADILRTSIEMFDEQFATLNLYGKLARISGMVGAISKRGYNAFHKYHYVTEGDLVGAVRVYLAAAGILMIPNTTSIEKDGDLTTVMVEYTVTDGSGYTFTFAVPGAGSDRGDKGVYKALTGSQKYAIMKLFKIETGDDPEADTRVDERAAHDGAPATRPVVRRGERGDVQRGGHTGSASPVQLRRISEMVSEAELSREQLLEMVAFLFQVEVPTTLPDDEKEQGKVVLGVLKTLTSGQAGALIEALEAHLIAADMKAADQSGY